MRDSHMKYGNSQVLNNEGVLGQNQTSKHESEKKMSLKQIPKDLE